MESIVDFLLETVPKIYVVKTLQQDGHYEFIIKTSADEEDKHTVTKHDCTCRGFFYKKYCKHHKLVNKKIDLFGFFGSTRDKGISLRDFVDFLANFKSANFCELEMIETIESLSDEHEIARCIIPVPTLKAGNIIFFKHLNCIFILQASLT